MKFNVIFATTDDYLFGVNNQLPWTSVKEDMQHFNRITTDTFNKNTIVMGKHTWLSLPNKLSDRINVVISSSLNTGLFDECYKTLDDFIINHKPDGKVFIIGGNNLIEECLTKYKNLVSNIYYSVIKKNIKSHIYTNQKIYFNKSIIDTLNKYLIKERKTDIVHFYHYKLPKHEEHNYLNLLNKLINNGNYRQTRNAKTYSLFGDTLTFDLKKGFPLLTTKKTFARGIFEELIFFLKGQTNSKILEEKGVNIWKPNTTPEFIEKCNLPYGEGDMGPMYGFVWKHFGAEYVDCHTDYSNKGFNQIEYVLHLLSTDPYSRRILMTTYNPEQAGQGVLYPCHSIVIQFYITDYADKKMVSMNMYQRSVDFCCGVPFNIASNAFLLHLICNTLNIKNNCDNYYPDKLNLIMGDIHIYENHIEQAIEQIKRVPYDFPMIHIKNKHSNIEHYKWDDVELINYNSHPPIKYEMVA